MAVGKWIQANSKPKTSGPAKQAPAAFKALRRVRSLDPIRPLTLLLRRSRTL
jgi:hypothetical protein